MQAQSKTKFTLGGKVGVLVSFEDTKSVRPDAIVGFMNFRIAPFLIRGCIDQLLEKTRGTDIVQHGSKLMANGRIVDLKEIRIARHGFYTLIMPSTDLETLYPFLEPTREHMIKAIESGMRIYFTDNQQFMTHVDNPLMFKIFTNVPSIARSYILKLISDGKLEISMKGLIDMRGTPCCICMESVPDHFFVPCGHTAVCNTCNSAMLQRKCPLCRAGITGMAKTPHSWLVEAPPVPAPLPPKKRRRMS